jgi:hypothetical protein
MYFDDLAASDADNATCPGRGVTGDLLGQPILADLPGVRIYV